MTEGTAVANTGPPKSDTARRNVRAELARAGLTHQDAARALRLSYAAFRRRIDDANDAKRVDFRAGELETLAQLLNIPLARLTEEPRP